MTTTPRVVVGVVAHARRAAAAKALAREVRAQFISIDGDGLLGCDRNHEVVQRHLCALPADWCVVLEDDAVPVPGFRDQLVAALAVAPTPVVSLYLGRLRPPQYQSRIKSALSQANAVGACWVTAGRLLHGVGYAVRSTLMPSLASFDSSLPADERVGVWAQSTGVSPAVGYTVPSLVDHADDGSLVAHRDGQRRVSGRVGWRVGCRDVWTGASVPLTA